MVCCGAILRVIVKRTSLATSTEMTVVVKGIVGDCAASAASPIRQASRIFTKR